MTPESKTNNTSNHLANERTFLAWIRTSIGIMAFGFVLVKFSLFLKQLSIVLEKKIVFPGKGYSGISGIILVAMGVLTSLFAYIRYKKIQKQINQNTFQDSSLLLSFLTVFILVMGILLIVYLIESI
ncbi:MAG TPA: DUF202 domain-containing protein [Puia sp.]|nr:DUF202 domain-containing protein [Puia sp.]